MKTCHFVEVVSILNISTVDLNKSDIFCLIFIPVLCMSTVVVSSSALYKDAVFSLTSKSPSRNIWCDSITVQTTGSMGIVFDYVFN